MVTLRQYCGRHTQTMNIGSPPRSLVQRSMRMLTPFPSLELLLLLLLPLLSLLEPFAADWACCAAPFSVMLTVSSWPLCLSSS